MNAFIRTELSGINASNQALKHQSLNVSTQTFSLEPSKHEWFYSDTEPSDMNASNQTLYSQA